MIVITGAAGFIGSCMCAHLNSKGIRNIMLVDDFSSTLKKQNYSDKKFLNVIERNEFIEWFDLQYDSVEYIIHLGARTDTTEFNYSIFKTLNVDYIDIIVLCRAPRDVSIESAVEGMAQMVKEGKAKYIGLSEASAEYIRRAHAVHPVYCIE